MSVTLLMSLSNINAQDDLLASTDPVGKNESVEGEEEETKFEGGFNVGLDIYSRYIWRGVPYSTTPALQPGLSYSGEKGDFSFEAGTWASYSFGDNDILEIDMFLSFGFKGVNLTFTDYFYPSNVELDQFYNFKDNETGHTVEASISYEGAEKFPLSVLLSYDIYGADTYNSYYVELGYPITDNFSVALGGGNGWHLAPTSEEPKDDFGITNINFTYEKEIKFSDKFSLPISGSFILSPEWEKAYVVFGISL